MTRLLAPLTLALLLAACGQTASLRPKAGEALPAKPMAARTTPDADALMTPSDQSRPKRIDDVLYGSDKRPPDKFDLPPQG